MSNQTNHNIDNIKRGAAAVTFLVSTLMGWAVFDEVTEPRIKSGGHTKGNDGNIYAECQETYLFDENKGVARRCKLTKRGFEIIKDTSKLNLENRSPGPATP
jgi:hypothetical protein